MDYISVIRMCYTTISKNIKKTPLSYNNRLSRQYGHNIYLKREDLQTTRSFKLRGALNKIKKSYNENNNNSSQTIVCASAGNHAQGVAYSCNLLDIEGDIYVPKKTPLQKINRIKYYGRDKVNIHLYGSNFNETLEKAIEISKIRGSMFVHPYDDDDIINGQATIAYEIYNEIKPDIIVCCVGGGGMISGISKYSKNMNKECRIIGVEPHGADSMYQAMRNEGPIEIKNIDNFVDGASVSKVGEKTYEICKESVDELLNVDNNKICNNIVEFYENEGIILEPAGCLSISGLDEIVKDIDNSSRKNIVCVVSGGNNDMTRYNEIMDMSLKYRNLVHYYIVEFPQRPGELKLFINNILGKDDDIIRFEYIKKSNINYGKVLIGLQITNENNIFSIENNMNQHDFKFEKIDSNILL